MSVITAEMIVAISAWCQVSSMGLTGYYVNAFEHKLKCQNSIIECAKTKGPVTVRECLVVDPVKTLKVDQK